MKKHRAVFYGTSNDDVFAPVHGDDFVYAGDGNDTINDSGRTYDDDFYSGQGGDDLIFTNGGNDEIKGGTGNDSVSSWNIQDFSFDGGFGNDSIEFFVPENHGFDFTYPTEDKTVIKIFDNDTHDVLYKVTTWDVENFTLFGVG